MMDRFDEQLRADLRRAAQRPAVQPEWSAVRERAGALRRRRAAVRTAPIATMVLLGGLGFAALSDQQTPRVSVQSPSSVEQSTPQKSSTTVSLASAESTVVTVAAPIVSTTADQPAPDTTDEVGDGGESTETVQGGGTLAKRPTTTLAGSRPTTTTARPGTSVSPPTPTPAPTTTGAEAIRTGSCRGGSITVRISPSLALLSARPTAGFTIVENEIQDDEVKVKFSDGHYECAVRIRSDGRVQYDG